MLVAMTLRSNHYLNPIDTNPKVNKSFFKQSSQQGVFKSTLEGQSKHARRILTKNRPVFLQKIH